MAKILEKLHIPFKIADFLCELECGSKRVYSGPQTADSFRWRIIIMIIMILIIVVNNHN